MPLGEYRLVETEAPEGFVRLEAPIHVTVREAEVSAMQGTSPSDVEYDGETDTWLIHVWNSTGYALPSTGGMGTAPFAILGLSLVGAALYLSIRKWMAWQTGADR